MMIKLPKGHISPSQVDSWERCQYNWGIFSAEMLGFEPKRAPDKFLIVRKETHKTILEYDLAYKIQTGFNRGDTELHEHFQSNLEARLPEIREDPLMTGINCEDEIFKEIKYFKSIIAAPTFDKYRKEVKPIAVEKRLEGEIGGIPILGYLDLWRDCEIYERIDDLKRYDKMVREGTASNSRQLSTYSILTGVREVALPVIVENKAPLLKVDEGTITEQFIERTKFQYEVIGEQMEHALQTGKFLPVNKGDKNKGWFCDAKWCGAWRADAKDWITGKNISCPWGERNAVSVAVGGK